jgi:hypothetical protein
VCRWNDLWEWFLLQKLLQKQRPWVGQRQWRLVHNWAPTMTRMGPLCNHRESKVNKGKMRLSSSDCFYFLSKIRNKSNRCEIVWWSLRRE